MSRHRYKSNWLFRSPAWLKLVLGYRTDTQYKIYTFACRISILHTVLSSPLFRLCPMLVFTTRYSQTPYRKWCPSHIVGFQYGLVWLCVCHTLSLLLLRLYLHLLTLYKHFDAAMKNRQISLKCLRAPPLQRQTIMRISNFVLLLRLLLLFRFTFSPTLCKCAPIALPQSMRCTFEFDFVWTKMQTAKLIAIRNFYWWKTATKRNGIIGMQRTIHKAPDEAKKKIKSIEKMWIFPVVSLTRKSKRLQKTISSDCCSCEFIQLLPHSASIRLLRLISRAKTSDNEIRCVIRFIYFMQTNKLVWHRHILSERKKDEEKYKAKCNLYYDDCIETSVRLFKQNQQRPMVRRSALSAVSISKFAVAAYSNIGRSVHCAISIHLSGYVYTKSGRGEGRARKHLR